MPSILVVAYPTASTASPPPLTIPSPSPPPSPHHWFFQPTLPLGYQHLSSLLSFHFLPYTVLQEVKGWDLACLALSDVQWAAIAVERWTKRATPIMLLLPATYLKRLGAAVLHSEQQRTKFSNLYLLPIQKQKHIHTPFIFVHPL